MLVRTCCTHCPDHAFICLLGSSDLAFVCLLGDSAGAGNNGEQREHLLLKQRLHVAVKERTCAHAAKETFTSAVRLQEVTFTERRFCEGVEGWLHLHSHMVMKVSNESVAESMGCILDLHADSQRHLDMHAYSQEAFIHWNGPAPHEARQFIINSLCQRHGGGPHKWHFSAVGPVSKGWLVSEVVDGCLATKSKLSFMEQ